VVVTAHAEDDLYAVGGPMSAMVHAGTELDVLVVSDGGPPAQRDSATGGRHRLDATVGRVRSSG
jgi:LmbE family N-acetylglucosaminyl deacetylase